MLCGIIVLFAIIVLRLFSLQIIHGADYEESITASVSKELPVTAPRGNIYDRYGRPLAVNKVAYCVQVDCGKKAKPKQIPCLSPNVRLITSLLTVRKKNRKLVKNAGKTTLVWRKSSAR